jgi:hypothetical protein
MTPPTTPPTNATGNASESGSLAILEAEVDVKGAVIVACRDVAVDVVPEDAVAVPPDAIVAVIATVPGAVVPAPCVVDVVDVVVVVVVVFAVTAASS